MKISDNKAIMLSSILVVASIVFFIMNLPISKYFVWISIFIITILNAHTLLQAMNRDQIKEKLILLLCLYGLHILFSFLLNYVINQYYVDKVSQLTMHAKEILEFREYTFLLTNLINLFLSWNRCILYKTMFTERQE